MAWAAQQGIWPWAWVLFWFATAMLLALESCFDFPMYDWEYLSLVVFLSVIPVAAQLERLRQTDGSRYPGTADPDRAPADVAVAQPSGEADPPTPT